VSARKVPPSGMVVDDSLVSNRPETRAPPSKRARPTPTGGWGARRTIHLHTLDDVRVEMARVYRAMATGALAVSDGTRLAYTLSLLTKTIEASAIESRIAALEAEGPQLLFQLAYQTKE